MTKDPYSRSAKWYDSLTEPFNTVVRKIALKMWPPTSGMSVLDVGCGTGTSLKLYQQAGCEVFGIDSSPAMLAVARQKLGKAANLSEADASQMPYTDGSFDLVTVTLALHEMPQPTRWAVISEIKRVTKSEGRILVIDFNIGHLKFPKGWWFRGVIILMEILAGREHFRNYRHFLKHGGIPGLAQDVSLIISQTKIISGGNLGLFLLAVP